MSSNKTLKEIVDALIPDNTVHPLMKKALCMDLKRYVELKCEEQIDICINSCYMDSKSDIKINTDRRKPIIE